MDTQVRNIGNAMEIEKIGTKLWQIAVILSCRQIVAYITCLASIKLWLT